jgi:hypothetical protein
MEKKLITICKHPLKYNYYVTEEGHVWSEYSNKYIRELPDKNGYLKVRLSSLDLPKGKQHAYSVHRLVLENFQPIENMENMQVNHKDGDKNNNSLQNLEWVTCQENIQHAIDNNLRAKINGAAILNEEQVKEIIQRLLSHQETYKQISLDYGVCEETIARIKRKELWKKLTENINFN